MGKMQILNDNGKKTERALLILYIVIFGKRHYNDKKCIHQEETII